MGAELHADRPGRSYGDEFWERVEALYDEAFPGLPEGIARAAGLGVRWRDVTTPFARFEEGRCVAHVGVISHPMRFPDGVQSVAGIHAVCTTEGRRREGLCRELLARALAWADREHAVAKLHTDLPVVYEGHGFRTVQTHRFASRAAPAPNVRTRPLHPSTTPDDARLLTELLARRTPVSHRCATAEPGWMVVIDAALGGRLDGTFVHLPDHDAICAFADGGDHTLIVEVIAAELPTAAVVAGAAPDPARPRLYTFTPDLFEADVEAIPSPPAVGAFMVRGAWPAHSPFGLSPFWEH